MLRMSHADESAAESTPFSLKKATTVSNAATGCANTISLYNDEPSATTESPKGTTTSTAQNTTLWTNSACSESEVVSRRVISQTITPPAALRLAKVDSVLGKVSPTITDPPNSGGKPPFLTCSYLSVSKKNKSGRAACPRCLEGW